MNRGREQSQKSEWDPMQDEFEDSTYEAQYPDDDTSGGVNLDHCRLYVTNIPRLLSSDGLRTAFSKYGTLVEIFMSADPKKRFGIVAYETPGEAKLAMMKLNRTEPLKLNINIAHKRDKKKDGGRQNQSRSDRPDRTDRMNSSSSRDREPVEKQWEDTSSVGSRRNRRKDEISHVGDHIQLESDMDLTDTLDPDLHLELEQLKLEQLKIQEAEIQCRQRMLLLNRASKKTSQTFSTKERAFLPDGRIIVKNTDKSSGTRNDDDGFTGGAGDANEREAACCCKDKKASDWARVSSTDDGSSTPSTCVLCSEDRSRKATDKDSGDKSTTTTSKMTKGPDQCRVKNVDSRTTDITSKKSEYSKATDVTNRKTSYTGKTASSKRTHETKHTDDSKVKVKNKMSKHKSEMTCDFKYSEFYNDSEDDADETNRLIQLRSTDYAEIVDDHLRIVIALAGYPKTKMRLRQMEQFQKSLSDVIEMQLQAGLLKKVPSFLDYYLNRGAIVCVCKDDETRDWMVRVSPGLQERMSYNLILLKAKIKRLCLAVLKISSSSWPATAQDAFRLLEYFNPTLKTALWKIYAQKTEGPIEITSFLIDRVSGEIIRGPTFKNVIDYSQMEFELTGFTEIYYDCLLSDLEEDLHSVASRVKLLDELRSGDVTSRASVEIYSKQALVKCCENNVATSPMRCVDKESQVNLAIEKMQTEKTEEEDREEVKKEFESMLQKDILKKLKDVEYISDKNEVIIWSDDTYYFSDNDNETGEKKRKVTQEFVGESGNLPSTSAVAMSDKTESYLESCDNLALSRASNLNIDSNRGIAYHRRTNYLHVESELKIAISLEGYPVNKLEGTHIRRLKHLFKEYLHKDMKNQRFTNLIIPKFQDVYLSNGAVIYVCDSLETKDYLTEVLPKFVNSTGLKLGFRQIKDLVRYTRVVMRLPKEHANVESIEILLKLQVKYPGLKPDRWKYYSDVAGKQKREFGVEPDSLEIIKDPDFDPTYEGEKLSFRIIDRQKKDTSYDGSNKESCKDDDEKTIKLKEFISKNMYVPIDSDRMNIPLTRIRTNHYSDYIPDDLKLYVGPSNYPQSRLDESLFHSTRRAFENVLLQYAHNESTSEVMPKFHDMYLFDGVIFIICTNKQSRLWVEKALADISSKVGTNLKATEFRGAVGIVSMTAKTERDPDEVIDTLQQQNPRLRTKYWRKISTVKTKTKLDVVLQIDKLSAQVITSEGFNKYINDSPVQFKLGHLQSLIKPKCGIKNLCETQNEEKQSEEKRDTPKDTTSDYKDTAPDACGIPKSRSKVSMLGPKHRTFEDIQSYLKKEHPHLNPDNWDVISQTERDNHRVCDVEIDEESAKVLHNEEFKLSSRNEKVYFYTGFESPRFDDLDPVIIGPESPVSAEERRASPVYTNEQGYTKMIMKIPVNILPENKEDLSIIFDLLEDKNPGVNTEIWQVVTDNYPNKGRLTIFVDRQSVSVINSKKFDPTIGGERLRFYF